MRDTFFYKARREDYRARSAFKLKSINNKYHFIKPKDCVIDLGCAPGSWLQVSKEIVGKGIVIGIDLQHIRDIPGVIHFQMDIFDDSLIDKLMAQVGVCDVVLSDMAPSTTGMHEIDCERSADLANRAFMIAKKILRKNGSLLVKVFQSPAFEKLLQKFKKHFEFVKSIKPEASKKKSREMFILGMGFRLSQNRYIPYRHEEHTDRT